MPRTNFLDAQQQALGFLVNQLSYIEATVYETLYPDIIYPQLISIDESAPDWTKSITFFSMSRVGQADWFHHMATDMRLADVSREKFEQGVEMAGIGYRYTLEELGQAQQAGVNLNPERAAAAIRAYEEFVETIAISGDTRKGWTGLINDAGVTAVTAPNGAATTPQWSTKTGPEIATDINNAITAVYTGTNTVEMADTVLLPVDQFTILATKQFSASLDITVLDWITRYNVFTAQTGRPLMIRALRQLDGAAGGGVDRMVVYRRDPSVVKMHIPMRHRFLPVWQTGPITFDIPGIFRIAGVEIRRPSAFRYVNAI